MNFTKYFSLKLKDGHADINFVDIDLYQDTKLFIDPSLIEGSKETWCVECNEIISSFFESVFKSFELGNDDRLSKLLSFGGEPNETKLGLSRGKPKGRGTSSEGLVDVFKDVLNRNLLSNKIIENPMDMCVFVHDFAEDRMSDLVTNILRKKLNEFTIEQCKIHKINLSDTPINIGKNWNYKTEEWEDAIQPALLVDDSVVLLVPKIIVNKSFIYSSGEYLNKKVIEYRQDYHVKNNTGLSQLKHNKKRGDYTAPPSKKTIREKEIGDTPGKDYILKYTLENPDLIIEFRNNVKRRIQSGEHTLTNDQLDNILY